MDRSWLEIRELVEADEIRDYLRLRYRIYVETEGYLPSNRDRIDITTYDLHSRFLGAFQAQTGELVGGMRMILPDADGPRRSIIESLCREADEPALRRLPPKAHQYFTEEAFDLGQLRRFCQDRGLYLVEFGRNVCLPEHRRLGVGYALVYAIYGLGLLCGAEVGVASGPLALKSFYARFGCNFLERRGTARPDQVHTDLFCMVLDLQRLGAEPSPLARRARYQLERYGRILLCEQRQCLGEHDHLGASGPARPGHALAREYDWRPPEAALPLVRTQLRLVDRSLGDGPLSPSAGGHSLEARREILRRMPALGIDSAYLGCAGRDADLEALLGEARACGVTPLVEVGSARQLEELARAAGPVTLALRLDPQSAPPLPTLEGLEWMAILDDVMRTPPESLEVLLCRLKQAGVARVLLEDSAGRATPAGVRRMVEFVRSRLGPGPGLEWSGANDRGLAVANSLAALESGLERLHAAALGLGPRCGGTRMESLLVNLASLAGRPLPEPALEEYLRAAGRAYGVPLPARYARSPQQVAR